MWRFQLNKKSLLGNILALRFECKHEMGFVLKYVCLSEKLGKVSSKKEKSMTKEVTYSSHCSVVLFVFRREREREIVEGELRPSSKESLIHFSFWF